MKYVVLALLLASASTAAANAESFTFTSTNTVQNAVVAIGSDGKPVQAAFSAGQSNATYASGRMTTNTFSCANWSSTPGSIFDSYGACNYSEPGGDSASIIAGCDYANKDQTEVDCWGALNGLDGPHKGKTGTMSWRQKIDMTAKTGTAVGTGQWND